MHAMRKMENKFAAQVDEHHWNRKKTPFKPLSSDDILDFPELTIAQLEVLFTGTYQLGQAVAYLGDIV